MRENSYFKRSLAMIMAIIMVFTYMPAMAWADSSDEVTEITKVEQFADMTPGGNYKLGKDITVTKPYEAEFNGTFDGDGHTVTLDVDRSSLTNNKVGTGLFCTVGTGAVIKNLCTAGSVKGYENVGGIAGINSGNIQNCKNTANVAAKGRYVAGISGKSNAGLISDCYNLGAISSERTRSGAGLGGIVGYAENVNIKNCYNVGAINFNPTTTNIGGVVGWVSNTNLENCYYLMTEGLTAGANGKNYEDPTISKTADEMKAADFVNLLGDAFMAKVGGYPALKWETPTVAVAFTVTPEDAVLNIGGKDYTGSCNVALAVGTHEYTISREGYTSQAGTVTVTESGGVLTASPASVTANLAKDDSQWAEVSFNIEPNTAEFVLKDNGETVSPKPAEEPFKYALLKSRNYTFEATAEGYEDESGTYSFEADGATKNVTLKKIDSIELGGTYKTEYVQGDKLDTTGLEVTVKYDDGTSKVITEGFKVEGFDSKDVAESQTLTVSYKGKTATYDIVIGEKLFPSSVFNALKGKVTVEYSHNASFKGEDGKEFVDDAEKEALKSNSMKMDSSEVAVNIKINDGVKASKLYFDYEVSSESSSNYASDRLEINKGPRIGTTDGFVTHEMQVKGGDSVKIAYVKDYSGDNGSDCIWLKNFRLVELHNLNISTPGVTGADIALKDETGKTIKADNGVYSVEDGTYHYVISKFGYESSEGDITVEGKDVEKPVTLKELTKKVVNFSISLPQGVEGNVNIEIKTGNKVVENGSAKNYRLPAGEYTYTITHPNCETESGNFTVADADVPIAVTLTRKLVFADVFSQLKDIEATNSNDGDKNTSYGFEPLKVGEDILLLSNNKGKGSSTSAMKLVAKSKQKLTFQYKVSTEKNYDKFTILKNGTSQIGDKSGVVDWTEYSVNLAPNDVLILKYYKDSSTDKNDDIVSLRNFSAKDLHTLSFTGAPEGTEIVVKQGDTVIEAESDGTYALEKGEYTYTATAFGYESKSGTITVDSADINEKVELVKSETQDVHFAITKPEGITADAAVVVKQGNKTISAETNGSYKLPAGNYDYTVTCEGCEKENGSFMVEKEAKTVNVVLEKKLVFEDFFGQFKGRATVENDKAKVFNAKKEKGEKYLQSTNVVSGTTSKITFNFNKPTRMSFKYMVSESGSSYTGGDYGLKVTRNGKTVDRYEEISKNWGDYEVLAKQGDKITIEYKCYDNDNAFNKEDENWIKVKDFKAEPLTKMTFNGMPENAKIKIMKGKEEISPVEGNYLLEKGTYNYTITAFGYEPINATELEVTCEKDEDVVNVSMTPTARTNVTFTVAPENASIVVKNADGDTMTANEDNAKQFSLPKGETYSYAVSAGGHVGKTGYFTADKEKTIEVELESAGDAWDGTTKTEPALVDGVYQINNGAELAWFAAKVSENSSISAKLLKNINLNGKEWTGFGKYDYNDDNSGYAGTIDGNGMTIIGLKSSEGFISCLAPNGLVKNLSVDGTVAGSGHIAGIAGTSKGTIENCKFSGAVTNSSATSSGGIIGRGPAGNKIMNCYSDAAIRNTCTYYNSELRIGGIAGYTYGSIENCYFTGSIYADPSKVSNKAIGGLAGVIYASGNIKNCYSIASVTGPESGIGALVGDNSGTIENCYVLEGIASKAVANNKSQAAPGIEVKTSAEMKGGMFAYKLGNAFNQDSTENSINNGYPILKWQGGSVPVVPEFEQHVDGAVKAIIMKDLARAEELAAQKKAIDDEVAADGGLEKWREMFDEPEMTMEDIYRANDIDLDDDGTLTTDTNNVYQIKKNIRLQLPAKGENDCNIKWSSNKEDLINIETGNVTMPESGKAEVVLTATVSKGTCVKTKTFTFSLWSEGSEAEELLANLKAKAEKTSTFIQPLHVYGHTNITQAMEQWIGRQDAPVDGLDDEGIKVTFLEAGKQTMPCDNKTYITSDEKGTIKYFKGTEYGFGTKFAIYDGVKFKLEYKGAVTEVSTRAHIGWDAAYVEELLNKAMEKVTWDTIKGTNTNTAEVNESDLWSTTLVNGDVTGELILPYTLDKITYATIKWSASDMKALYVTDNNDGTYTANLERPAKGEEPNKFILKGVATFNFWDDYTIDELTSQGVKTDPAESIKLFNLSVPANSDDQSDQIQEALDKYPTKIKDFVDKTKEIDTSKVSNDLQMPRPADLEELGILPDRYNQKVVMTSADTDVLEFNGYHAVVYRPLPGEKAKTVEYTVKILDRRNNALLGEKTFEITVLPLTQKEIDDAAKWMNEICTEEVYWNGIKGENTSKDNITSPLASFEEILNKNGETEYVRGAINLTFGGAEVDDLPGYDSMHTQPWRQFRSSKHSVVACESLLIAQPEYNTKVKIDSVLSHSEFAKYWKKFSDNEKYKEFEQFYKRPVATTVTVIGTKNTVDPNPQPTTISVNVSIDGKGTQGFVGTNNIKVDGLDADTSTAWDAVRTAFTKAGYTYSGVGDYVASITDPKGVTLSDTDTKNSGWLYKVNGKLPNVYMGSYYLANNDNIVLYYTGDYKEEPDFGDLVNPDTPKADVTTSGESTNDKITTSATEVTVSNKTNADGTSESTAVVTVKKENQEEIIKQAKENKSKEIVLDVASSDSKGADNIQLELPKDMVNSIVKDTQAVVTVKSEQGEMTIDRETLAQISKDAKGGSITVIISKMKTATEEQKKLTGESTTVYKLTIMSGNEVISQFNGKITVKLPIPAVLLDKTVAAVHFDSVDKFTVMDGKRVTEAKKDYYVFDTTHFSEFGLVDAKEAGITVDDNVDKVDKIKEAKKIASKMKLTTVATKTKKKTVKVNVKMTKNTKADIKALKDLGCNVKYSFYRSTKKSGNYKVAATKKANTYTYVKGKKAKRYYYKTQIRIYDKKGKLITKTTLKNSKCASRVWVK